MKIVITNGILIESLITIKYNKIKRIILKE